MNDNGMKNLLNRNKCVSLRENIVLVQFPFATNMALNSYTM